MIWTFISDVLYSLAHITLGAILFIGLLVLGYLRFLSTFHQ